MIVDYFHVLTIEILLMSLSFYELEVLNPRTTSSNVDPLKPSSISSKRKGIHGTVVKIWDTLA